MPRTPMALLSAAMADLNVGAAADDGGWTCGSPAGCLRSGVLLDDAKTPEPTVRVLCSWEHCQRSPLMHRSCFDVWEASVLNYLRGCGRARGWSERQRHQNLWTKKGYDLAYKACGCPCGRGHLRKDPDWPPPSLADADSEQRRRGRKKGAASASSSSSSSSSSSASSLSSSVGQSVATLGLKSVALAVKSASMNGAGGARNRANSLSSNGSGSSSSGSSSPPEEACVSAAVAGPGGPVSAGHGSANGAGGPGHGSASGAGGPGTGHAGSSAARGGGGGGGASAAAPASVGHAVASLLLKRRHLNQRAACDALDRESRNGSGNCGLFSHRMDFSSFNALPRHKLNSYHIKMEDEGSYGNDDIRCFILSNLATARMANAHCVVCQGAMAIFDRYPLIDGTFFLSPKQYTNKCIPVTVEGRHQYLCAVCMACLEGWTCALRCRSCRTQWDGSSLILGTMYSYDVFAAVPCCPDRLRCNNCSGLVVSPEQRYPFFSQYSRELTCPHCSLAATHFVKALPSVFQMFQPSPASNSPVGST